MRTVIKKILHCLVVFPSLFAFGCATTQIKSANLKQALAGVSSVSISDNVSVPEHPKVIGKAASTGFFFGPIVGAIVAESATGEAEELQSFMQTNGIDIKAIAKREFLEALKAANIPLSIAPKNGDAEFQLAIIQYGLAPDMSLSLTDKPLCPTVVVTASLAAKNGSILWKNTGNITALSEENKCHKIAEYYSNPKLLEQVFQKAVYIVVHNILLGL